MATASVNYTTSASNVNVAWRKIQGKLQKGFQTMTEEWDMVDDLPDIEMPVSAREMTIPIDLTPAYGAASIPEAGLEAQTGTPNLSEITVVPIFFNQRWSTSLTARYYDEKSGGDAAIIKQLKYQALKAIESLSNTFGMTVYGTSAATIALNTTVATQSSGAYTLSSGFGQAFITDTTYIGSLFAIGQRVALIRTGALVTNAIGVITAVSGAVITVTWNGSVTSANGDAVVFANSIENTTIAGTDYNAWPVGLLDSALTTSIHSLSGSSVPNWNPAVADSSGGRFSWLRTRKARQKIQNLGGGKLDRIIWANGVENDVVAGERAALRYTDASGMDLNDGSVKRKGVTQFTSRHVPPTCAWAMDSSGFGKFMVLKKPSAGQFATWNDGVKAEDRSALKFSIDLPYFFATLSRRKIAFYSGLTEQ